MSQTSSAVETGGGNAAQETLVPMRWVVLFTGTKATEDYEPAASEGEDASLVKEVTAMAVAFHPHSEIRLFPSDRGVLLFWQAQTTGDWVVTDIALAPNPNGVRTALEYVSFLLKDEDLARLRFNPFEVTKRGLHEKLREHFLAGRRDPLPASLPAAPRGINAASPVPATAVSLPNPGNISTQANARALETFCASGLTGPPPTFATWWAANGTPPDDAFEIVLRAEPPKTVSLRDVVEEAVALAGALKTALPETASTDTVTQELARSIVHAADTISSEVSTAASRLNDESPDRFRERLGEATAAANRLISDLGAYRQRLGNAAFDATVLDELGEHYAGLARNLAQVRHPNPFAAPKANGPSGNPASINRNGSSSGAASESFTRDHRTGTATGSGTAAKAGIAAVAAIAAVGGAAFLLRHHGGGGGGGNSQPTPTPKHSSGGGSGATKGNAFSPGAATLLRSQSDAIPFARSRAHDAAYDLAKRSGGDSLEDSRIEKIAAGSVLYAYKKLLSDEDYRTAFGSSPAKSWNYARLKKTVPDLAAAAHESALLGATEGRMDAVNSRHPEATPAAPAAETTPTPRPRRATPEPAATPEPEHGTRRPTPEPERPTPKPATPRPATPRPATPKPAAATPKPPATGTADQNNL